MLSAGIQANIWPLLQTVACRFCVLSGASAEIHEFGFYEGERPPRFMPPATAKSFGCEYTQLVPHVLCGLGCSLGCLLFGSDEESFN